MLWNTIEDITTHRGGFRGAEAGWICGVGSFVNMCKMANSVDPDQMPRYVASYLNLHCLLRTVFPNTLIKSNLFGNHPGSARNTLQQSSKITHCMLGEIFSRHFEMFFFFLHMFP